MTMSEVTIAERGAERQRGIHLSGQHDDDDDDDRGDLEQ